MQKQNFLKVLMLFSTVMAVGLSAFALDSFERYIELTETQKAAYSSFVLCVLSLMWSRLWGFYDQISNFTPRRRGIVFLAKMVLPLYVLIYVSNEVFYVITLNNSFELTVFERIMRYANGSALIDAGILALVAWITLYVYDKPKHSGSRWVHMKGD